MNPMSAALNEKDRHIITISARCTELAIQNAQLQDEVERLNGEIEEIKSRARKRREKKA